MIKGRKIDIKTIGERMKEEEMRDTEMIEGRIEKEAEMIKEMKGIRMKKEMTEREEEMTETSVRDLEKERDLTIEIVIGDQRDK